MKMKTKTLKEIRFQTKGLEADGSISHANYMKEDEIKKVLKQEAFNWIDKLNGDYDNLHKFGGGQGDAMVLDAQMRWIEQFFNITEEELEKHYLLDDPPES